MSEPIWIRSGNRGSGARAAAFGVVLVVAAFAIYWPALSGSFIWDDTAYVTASPLVHAPDGVYRMWFTGEAIDYWPVMNTVLWLEWRLWGLNPAGYHAVSVLMHAASALLFYVILRQLTIPNAHVAAWLFVVHPLNVQSVAWIAETKNTLSLLFLLLATLLYFLGEVRPTATTLPRNPDTRRRIAHQTRNRSHIPSGSARQPAAGGSYYALSLVAFALAMLSKGSVATFPGMLLLLVWWRTGHLNWRDVRRLLPFLAIAIALTVVNIWFQTRHVTGTLRDVTTAERLLGAAAVIWFYLAKALLPVNLMFVYPQWNIHVSDIRWWIPTIAAVVTTAVLWWKRKQPVGGALLLAWGTFCLALVPVMGLTDVYYMRYSLVADHYAYIALLPVVALIAACLDRVFTPVQRSLRSGGLSRRALVGNVGAAILIAALGSATWSQSHLYADATTVWTATTQSNPVCWLCETNLAVPLVARGTPEDLVDAVAHLNTAIRLNPRAPESHDGLGVALQKLGRFEQAVAEHERALALDPHFSEARSNLVVARQSLGIELSKAGRFEEAAATLALVLRDAPNSAATHRELGYALLQLGRKGEALAHVTESVRLDPSSPETHDTLATVWRAFDRQVDAIAEYRKAVSLAPNAAEWHNNLGSALLEADRLDEAEHEFRESLRCNPLSPLAQRNLGVTLAELNRLDEAAEHLREALRLQPDFADARANLDEVTARMKKKSTL